MRPLQISEEVYRDKVHACWLGKNIGGTLGAPYEGHAGPLALSFFDPIPTTATANDDLDLQLVWLKMLQERGIRPSVGDFADYWQKHLGPYPWNEYGFCQRNLARGLRPPISGCYENYYVDDMGSPIRSEIWACVAPGDPGLAASLAWSDAVLDHAGGEGVYGEMFWAALQSAAFVFSDPLVLIHVGLCMIPIHSLIARAVAEAVLCHQSGVEWAEARERVHRWFRHENACNAPQNHGFTILGWLYGEDFGSRLCAAVNCGCDTDCTGATLGATLGLIGGTAALPAEWREPVGEAIVLHRFTHDLAAPATVAELTAQTVDIGRRLLAERSEVSGLGEETVLPEDLLTLLFDNRRALEARLRDPQSAIETAGGYEVALHYGGEPVLRPGIGKTVGVSVREAQRPDRLLDVEVSLRAPEGWKVEPAPPAFDQKRFTLRASEVPARSFLTVTVELPGGARDFQYSCLGPEEARGYAARGGVPTCCQCGARVEACICER